MHKNIINCVFYTSILELVEESPYKKNILLYLYHTESKAAQVHNRHFNWYIYMFFFFFPTCTYKRLS